MMNHAPTRDRTKRLYDLHAWTGVIAGLFLFVVSFSGIAALFTQEVLTWENPNLRIERPAQPAAINARLDAFAAEQGARGEITFMRVDLPTSLTPYYEGRILVRPPGEKSKLDIRRWHPATGERLPERGKGVSNWLQNFHTDLMLPSPYGRYLVGLAGIILLLSVVSGLLTHRKMLREAFTWRLERSVRLKWQDSHKALGLWGAPFHIMIAFTGAILGLASLFALLVGIIAFKGDAGSVRDAVLPERPAAAGIAVPMSDLRAVARTAEHATGGRAEFITISHWGDQNATFNVYLKPANGELVRYIGADVDGVSGQVRETYIADTPGLAGRVFASMTPLHYATYGGIALKFIYTLLGAALCVLIVLGLMMWLERRTFGNEGRMHLSAYRALSRLTIGVSAGLCLSTVAILYGDKLIPARPDERLFQTGAVFFGVWIAALMAAFIPANEYRLNRAMLAMFGLGLVGLPGVNWLMTGDHLIALARDGHWYAAGVDIFGLSVGAVVLASASALPDRRPEPDRYSRHAFDRPAEHAAGALPSEGRTS